jgi:aminomethyltransferase
MTAAPLEVSGIDTLACGTGYTGEDGLELLCDPDDAPALWDAVIEAGAVPCGLGARDTLRLEAGYHLHGNDMDSRRNPIEAGLGWACREETGFIGAESVARARSEGTDEVLVAFEMAGNGIARAGNLVAGGGAVTSGTFSPTLEVGIGMAYVPASGSEPGTELEIDVRGKPRHAIVRERPLYRKAD